MKTFAVFWTRQAAFDLEEIADYIAGDAAAAAAGVFRNIKTRCAALRTHPERFRMVPELAELGIPHYREIVAAPYRIIYKVEEKRVCVLAVVDGRRDMEDFLFRRLVRV